jgi:hypothetical protein
MATPCQDTVMSFVPADSDDTLSDELRTFAEATNAWMPYRPTESTALLVDVPTERLDKAFREIAMKKPRAAGGGCELEFIIDGAMTSVKDHVFVHGTKLSRPVRDRLQAHGLMLPEDFAKGFTSGDWLVVDTEASGLILSYIADRLAEKKGWTSIPKPFSFSLMSFGLALGLEKRYSAARANVCSSYSAKLGTPSILPRLSALGKEAKSITK